MTDSEDIPVVRTKRLTKPDGTSCNVAPYKDVIGRYRTESLFYETMAKAELDREIYWPIFTLNENDLVLTPSNWYYDRYPDHKVPSLRKIYLAEADPAEYDFSMKVFKSDRHWKILTKCTFFQPYLEEWRSTLRTKLHSAGIKTLLELAMSGPGPQALQAAKWLAEFGFEPKQSKGRPTNQQVAVETRKSVEQDRILLEDAERIGVKLPNA